MRELEFVKLLVVILVVTIIGGTIWVDVKSGWMSNPDDLDVTVDTFFIRSISYQSDSKADFILGCGSIYGKDYYVCYQVLDDGGIQLMRITAQKAIIYETLDADDTAYVEIEKNGFGITKSIKLYVPIGTIYEQYNFQ